MKTIKKAAQAALAIAVVSSLFACQPKNEEAKYANTEAEPIKVNYQQQPKAT
jgi:uncharacterized lipoprotein YehR (DUF1307 family)